MWRLFIPSEYCILPLTSVTVFDMEDPYAQYEVVKKGWIPQMHRRSYPPQLFTNTYNTPDDFRSGFEAKDALEFLPSDNQELTVDDLRQMYPLVRYLNQVKLSPEEIQTTLTPEEYDKLSRLLTEIDRSSNDEEDPFERFTLTYNTPDNFRAGWESRDALPEPRIYFDENDDLQDEYGSGYNDPVFQKLKSSFDDDNDDNDNHDNNYNNKEIFRELQNRQRLDNGIYTEGGVVYPPLSDQPDTEEEDRVRENLDKLFTKYNLGFKRPERLDVKKPGPPFATQIVDDKRGRYLNINNFDNYIKIKF